MLLTFGKHRNSTVAGILRGDPSYIYWMLSQEPTTDDFFAAQQEALRLIAEFDATPFAVQCRTKDWKGRPTCNNRATRCSVYKSSLDPPYWWCDSCDPYSEGAMPGRLQVISTYVGGCAHVVEWCKSDTWFFRRMIQILSDAKERPPLASMLAPPDGPR